jgi:hypothetical protein
MPISAKELQHFLSKSYDKTHHDYKNYQVDTHLTGQRVQVYYDSTKNHAVVVHRGTKGVQDWGTDASLLLTGYQKNNRRFAHARKIQNQAEEKYGQENITTLGDSLGAKIAEKVGNKTKEVITLNKPTIPMDLIKGKKVPKNQTDIRTSRDPVSILRPFQKPNNKEITIPSKTLNPFREHSTDVLSRLHEDTLFGGVRGKVCEKCLYCD